MTMFFFIVRYKKSSEIKIVWDILKSHSRISPVLGTKPVKFPTRKSINDWNLQRNTIYTKLIDWKYTFTAFLLIKITISPVFEYTLYWSVYLRILFCPTVGVFNSICCRLYSRVESNDSVIHYYKLKLHLSIWIFSPDVTDISSALTVTGVCIQQELWDQAKNDKTQRCVFQNNIHFN